jgi:peroxiredoxin
MSARVNNPALAIGSPIPSFSDLPGADGRSYSASDFSASDVLVIVFSCNHCPYVRAYEDRMIAFQDTYGKRGVQLVAVNANEERNYPEDGFEDMITRAAMMAFNFPYLRDERQVVAGAFGATHTPEFFVADRNRVLRYHGRMDDNHSDPSAVKKRHLVDAVEAILQGRPVAEPEVHSIGCTIKWAMDR